MPSRAVAVVARAPVQAVSGLGRAGAVIGFLAVLLAADTQVALPGQLVLGALTWVALGLALMPVSPIVRAQTIVVVVVATCGEIVGSLIWGVYTYRLENLPLFVPPGHGLVYLTGLHLSETRLLKRHPRPFVAVVLAFAGAWMLAGLTVLPRTDVVGAVGAVAFAYCVVRSRARAAYCGVFVAVAALEIYGTAIGTWQWKEVLPGTGLPNGNPPSGVASGYVFFDVVAMALAPRLVTGVRSVRSALRERRDEGLGDDLHRTAGDLARAA
jgi:hypothetical protein